jgi:hypothetical protein
MGMCALWVLWIWDVLDWHYEKEFTVMIVLAVLGVSYEEVFSQVFPPDFQQICFLSCKTALILFQPLKVTTLFSGVL